MCYQKISFTTLSVFLKSQCICSNTTSFYVNIFLFLVILTFTLKMLRHIEGLLFLQASSQIGLVTLFDKFRCFLTFVFTALKNPNGNQWIFVFVLLYKRNFEKRGRW